MLVNFIFSNTDKNEIICYLFFKSIFYIIYIVIIINDTMKWKKSLSEDRKKKKIK